jgi:hypothetical protein
VFLFHFLDNLGGGSGGGAAVQNTASFPKQTFANKLKRTSTRSSIRIGILRAIARQPFSWRSRSSGGEAPTAFQPFSALTLGFDLTPRSARTPADLGTQHTQRQRQQFVPAVLVIFSSNRR